MTITDWNDEVPRGSDLQVGLDDPAALWAELERQMCDNEYLVDEFKRYSVGLREVLQDSDHSFHHAGGCGCCYTEAEMELNVQDIDGHDHATRVLIAVGAPDHAFGKTLRPGDVLAWTTYHGIVELGHRAQCCLWLHCEIDISQAFRCVKLPAIAACSLI